MQLQQRRRIGTVPLLAAVGNIDADIAADSAEETQQQRRGRRAVDIVVAEHDDALALLHRAYQPSHGGVHVLEVQRIGQELAQGRLEEVRHVVETDIARRQQPRHRVGQSMALRDGQRRPLVAEPRGPAPAGQRLLDAEERRSFGAGFGGHAITIAQAAVDITYCGGARPQYRDGEAAHRGAAELQGERQIADVELQALADARAIVAPGRGEHGQPLVVLHRVDPGISRQRDLVAAGPDPFQGHDPAQGVVAAAVGRHDVHDGADGLQQQREYAVPWQHRFAFDVGHVAVAEAARARDRPTRQTGGSRLPPPPRARRGEPGHRRSGRPASGHHLTPSSANQS